MRKQHCNFKMNYTSEAGELTTANSYFDFVELDGYACWIGVDVNGAADQSIAMMVVNQVLNDFVVQPTISKRKFIQYIRNVQRLVANLSRNVKLKIGLAIVVTDYTKMLCLATGNERIYRFPCRAGLEKTAGAIIWELGGIEPDHNSMFFEDCSASEDDSLLGSFSVKTLRLNNDDVILLCNSGLWKMIRPDEIFQTLSGVKDPLIFLNELKEILLQKQGKILHNYTAVAIFVDCIDQKTMLDSKKTWLAIAAVMLSLLVLAIFSLYLQRIMPDNQVAKVAQEPIKPSVTVKSPPVQNNLAIYERNGDRLSQMAEYQKALVEYTKAINCTVAEASFVRERVQKKLALSQLLIAADQLAAAQNFKAAFGEYRKAQKMAQAVQNYDPAGLQKRAATALAKLTVQKLVIQGDRKVAKMNFAAALDDYTKAQTLAWETTCDTTKFGLESKIKKVAGIVMDDLALQKLTGLQAEKERQEREKLAKEQQERLANERLEQEKQEQERLAKERQEQLDQGQPEQEKPANQKQ
jgi:hypothetical protein